MAFRQIALAQGGYWLATGLWSLVHYPSFEAVTGRRQDRRSAKAAGVLIAAAGATLLASGLRKHVSPRMRMAAAFGAATVGAMEATYGLRWRSRPPVAAAFGAHALALASWGLALLPQLLAAPGRDDDGVQQEDRYDPVLEASLESFPASDAPAW